MKRLFCVVGVLSLLLTACSSNTTNTVSTEEYKHIPYVSSIEQTDCLLCGEQTNLPMSSYWGEDNVGIVNLNTFDVLRIEINRYDDQGNLIEEAAGFMHTSHMQNEGTFVNAMTDPDRAYSHIQITGTHHPIDAPSIQKHLCQSCLDSVNGTYFGGSAPYEYAIINFSERTVHLLVKNCTWFTFGNYGIDCDFEDDGDIDLRVHYCPPRYK